MLNANKSSLFTKNKKSFFSIDLKVSDNLHTYRAQLHTKFWHILECLRVILVGFSGILHTREIFFYTAEYGFYEKPRTAVKSEPVTRLLQFFGW